MKNLTSAADACTAYMEDPTTCPYCEGDIIADEMTGDGRCQHQETHCGDCGARFTETYRLQSVCVDRKPQT